MNIAVRYYSRGGNTKKLAEAVAEAVGVEAKTVAAALEEKADILFLGTALYANGVDNAVKAFLQDNKENIGTVYSVSTAAIAPSTYHVVKKLTDALGIDLSEREYHCKSAFLFLNPGRPNDGDLTRAAAFAKQVVEKAGR